MTPDEKAVELAQMSIGWEVRILLGPGLSVVGFVKECSHVGWEMRGQKRHARFQMTVMAGKDHKYPHHHEVFQIPHPNCPADEVPKLRSCAYQESVTG